MSPAWTCPELRTVLTAESEYHRGGAASVPKGLSSMSLAELRAEATKLEIPMGSKETKGSLMLKIRDTTAPDTTVMTIGRFRGSCYTDIPDNYGDWASEEERRNGTNMSPDLKRFVIWRRHRRSQGNPERDAVVPPPPLSETGSSVWGVVEDPSGSLTDWRLIAPSTSRGMRDWRPETPSTTKTPFTKAKASRRREVPRAEGSHGTGGGREDGGRDPGTGTTTGSAQGSMRNPRAEVSEGKSSGPGGPHDTYGKHDDTLFCSCSSGSDDRTGEVFLSQRALAKLGEEATGARHHNGHPGELAAACALREEDLLIRPRHRNPRPL